MLNRIGPEQRAVIGLAVIAVFGEAAYAVINALALPVFVDRELQATTHLGLIVGSFLLAETLLKGPMGHISDRVGRRLILIVAPLGSALAAVAVTRAPLPSGTLAYLMVVRCVDGIAAAALWTTIYAAVADAVPEERRASAMSTLTLSYLGGVAIGPALGGWAARRFSLRAPFYLVAGLFVLASLAAMFLAPRQDRHASHHEQEGEVSLAGFVESLREAPQFLVIAFVVFLGVGLLIPIAPLMAMHLFGLDEERFGTLFIIPAILMGILAVPLGRLGDRWGPSRSVHMGMATAALALWALALLPKTEALLVLGAAALGLGFVIGLPAWLAVVSGLADPQHRGAMIGAVATAQGLGAFVGVLLGPVLFKAAGLAARLDPLWPGRLTSSLLPVLGAAVLMTLAWLSSLVIVRETPDNPG